MKSKIKLTDLSHLEPLNDEMRHLKGGDSSEEGPFCWGCKCQCECSNSQTGETTKTNDNNSARNTGNISWGFDVGTPVIVGVVVSAIL